MRMAQRAQYSLLNEIVGERPVLRQHAGEGAEMRKMLDDVVGESGGHGFFSSLPASTKRGVGRI
jgi:hypothetical protein